LLRFRLEGLGCGAKQVVQDIFWLWLRGADLCFVALGLFPFVSRADCAQALRDEVLQSESQSEQRPGRMAVLGQPTPVFFRYDQTWNAFLPMDR
jgi:hypothetical protein